MNEFVNKFKTQIDSFWDVGEDEKKKVLSDVLKYANSNQQKFKNEINQVKFDNDLMALPIISEALSTDTENWGQFYVDLLDDILETAKQSSKPNDILNNLQEFSYIENDSKPFVQKIVDRLYKEVDSENLNVKLAAIWTLPNYLDNNSLRNKSSIIDKLRQQLYDQNWKVRVVAFKSLGFENLLPDGYQLFIKRQIDKIIFWRATNHLTKKRQPTRVFVQVWLDGSSIVGKSLFSFNLGGRKNDRKQMLSSSK